MAAEGQQALQGWWVPQWEVHIPESHLAAAKRGWHPQLCGPVTGRPVYLYSKT